MKIKKTDSKGYFPEGWYVSKIVNIEPCKTIYGQRLLFWYEIKNQHKRTMAITDFFHPKFTNETRLGHITKIVVGEAKEFLSADLIGKLVLINLKKKIVRKNRRSYLNVVAYKKFKQGVGVDRGAGAGLEGTEPDATPSPEQIAELLKNDKTFALQVGKFLKQPQKKPDKTKKIGDILKEEGGA